MATVTTYLLISNPQTPGALDEHPLLAEHDFELQRRFEKEGIPALRFMTEHVLEDHKDLREVGRQLSVDIAAACVVVCTVEQRFNQIEHLKSVVFIEGQTAGSIEHGSVLNVGS